MMLITPNTVLGINSRLETSQHDVGNERSSTGTTKALVPLIFNDREKDLLSQWSTEKQGIDRRFA